MSVEGTLNASVTCTSETVIPACDPPCLNGGTCYSEAITNTSTVYLCFCTEAFYGDSCEKQRGQTCSLAAAVTCWIEYHVEEIAWWTGWKSQFDLQSTAYNLQSSYYYQSHNKKILLFVRIMGVGITYILCLSQHWTCSCSLVAIESKAKLSSIQLFGICKEGGGALTTSDNTPTKFVGTLRLNRLIRLSSI